MDVRFIDKIKIIGEWNWEKLSRCIVCNLPIENNEPALMCPYCRNWARRLNRSDLIEK